MTTYRINGSTRPQLIEKRINRMTMLAAVKQFYASNPNADIQTINGKEVIGFCENTGKPIFDGDRYECDNDGIMVLIRRAKR